VIQLEINKEILTGLANEAKQNKTGKRKIACNSLKAAAVLEYLKRTVPGFYHSSVCRDILEQALQQKYPDLWEEVERLVPKSKRKCFSWNWQVPEIKRDVITHVREYMDSERYRAVVTVHSPRSSVALEYIRRTEPKISMSNICSELLETELKKLVPELWDEIVPVMTGDAA
jgi:hypothetical protein